MKSNLKDSYKWLIEVLGTLTLYTFIIIILFGGKVYWNMEEGLLEKLVHFIFRV